MFLHDKVTYSVDIVNGLGKTWAISQLEGRVDHVVMRRKHHGSPFRMCQGADTYVIKPYCAQLIVANIKVQLHLSFCNAVIVQVVEVVGDKEQLGCWWPDYLTHWGRDKMAAISQTTCSSAFSWMKMFEFWLKFHWSLFLRVQLTIIQHCFR